MDQPNKNLAETFFAELPKLVEPRAVEIDSSKLSQPSIVMMPTGMMAKDFQSDIVKAAELHKPLARKGTATLNDLDSFINWTNRHKGDGSVIFAHGHKNDFSLTSVIDYNFAGPPTIEERGDPLARHGKHRGKYTFPLSKEWLAWQAACANPLSGPELGELIEDRAEDILNPSPGINGTGTPTDDDRQMIEIATKLGGRFGSFTTLRNLANEFKMQESTGMTAKTNRDTGETTIQFINEHKEPDGSPINIPTLFMIAIPVFDGDAAYRIAVRLRYRRAGTGVVWILSLYNPQASLDLAWSEAVNKARQETELPTFAGSAETV